MKAIAIKQPWAFLIVNGHKDIENRTRNFRIRGPILIHASKEVDRDYFLIKEEVKRLHDIDLPDWQDLETGGIVGMTTIVDCVREHDSPWKQAHTFGLVLAQSRPLKFRRNIGQLGIMNTPFEIGEDGELKK